MNSRIIARPRAPWHLWLVGAVALLWNAGGMASWYTVILGDPAGMGFTPEQVDYLGGYPAWALASYTMGTFGAFFGTLALLLQRALARTLFALAILGLAGTTFYERVGSTLPQSLQGTGQLVFTFAIWATTVGLLLYAIAMTRRGVLR